MTLNREVGSEKSSVNPYRATANIDCFETPDFYNACSHLFNLNILVNQMSVEGSSLGNVDFSKVPNVKSVGYNKCLSATLGINGSDSALNVILQRIKNGINASFNNTFYGDGSSNRDLVADYYQLMGAIHDYENGDNTALKALSDAAMNKDPRALTEFEKATMAMYYNDLVERYEEADAELEESGLKNYEGFAYATMNRRDELTSAVTGLGHEKRILESALKAAGIMEYTKDEKAKMELREAGQRYKEIGEELREAKKNGDTEKTEELKQERRATRFVVLETGLAAAGKILEGALDTKVFFDTLKNTVPTYLMDGSEGVKDLWNGSMGFIGYDTTGALESAAYNTEFLKSLTDGSTLEPLKDGQRYLRDEFVDGIETGATLAAGVIAPEIPLAIAAADSVSDFGRNLEGRYSSTDSEGNYNQRNFWGTMAAGLDTTAQFGKNYITAGTGGALRAAYSASAGAAYVPPGIKLISGEGGSAIKAVTAPSLNSKIIYGAITAQGGSDTITAVTTNPDWSARDIGDILLSTGASLGTVAVFNQIGNFLPSRVSSKFGSTSATGSSTSLIPGSSTALTPGTMSMAGANYNAGAILAATGAQTITSASLSSGLVLPKIDFKNPITFALPESIVSSENNNADSLIKTIEGKVPELSTSAKLGQHIDFESEISIGKKYAYGKYFDEHDVTSLDNLGPTGIPKEMILADAASIYSCDAEYAESTAEYLKNIRDFYGKNSPQAVTAEAYMLSDIMNCEGIHSQSVFDRLRDASDTRNNEEFIVEYIKHLFDETGLETVKQIKSKQEASIYFKKDQDFWKKEEEDNTDLYKSMYSYAGGGYYDMNGYMRGRIDTISEKDKSAIKELYNGLEQMELKDDCIMYRGLDNLDFFVNKYGLNPNEELSTELSKIPGGTVVLADDGFLSTTPVLGSGFTDKKVVEVIYTPKGTTGSYLGYSSPNGDEAEFLMQAGTGNKQVYLASEEINGKTYIFTMLVP